MDKFNKAIYFIVLVKIAFDVNYMISKLWLGYDISLAMSLQSLFIGLICVCFLVIISTLFYALQTNMKLKHFYEYTKYKTPIFTYFTLLIILNYLILMVQVYWLFHSVNHYDGLIGFVGEIMNLLSTILITYYKNVDD